MLGLINMLASDYIIESERETGSGRADIMLIPKAGKQNNAIIIEYKISNTIENLESIAKLGLEQINNKYYDAKVKEYSHVKKISKISMAFCGKEVALEYKIDIVS